MVATVIARARVNHLVRIHFLARGRMIVGVQSRVRHPFKSQWFDRNPRACANRSNPCDLINDPVSCLSKQKHITVRSFTRACAMIPGWWWFDRPSRAYSRMIWLHQLLSFDSVVGSNRVTTVANNVTLSYFSLDSLMGFARACWNAERLSTALGNMIETKCYWWPVLTTIHTDSIDFQTFYPFSPFFMGHSYTALAFSRVNQFSLLCSDDVLP